MQFLRLLGGMASKPKIDRALKLRDEFVAEKEGYVSACPTPTFGSLTAAYAKFDMAAFVDLCDKKSKEEKEGGKMSATRPTELLPNEKADLKWLRRTSWFSKLAKQVGESTAELRFNVEKRLEAYCQLARNDGQKLDGVFLLVVDYKTEEENAQSAEYMSRYFEGMSEFWFSSSKNHSDERFEGEEAKIIFRLTFLIHMKEDSSMLNSIGCLIATTDNLVESIRVVDYYYFFGN